MSEQPKIDPHDPRFYVRVQRHNVCETPARVPPPASQTQKGDTPLGMQSRHHTSGDTPNQPTRRPFHVQFIAPWVTTAQPLVTETPAAGDTAAMQQRINVGLPLRSAGYARFVASCALKPKVQP
jgi:hypothetical protein